MSIYLHPHTDHLTCEYLPTPSPRPSHLWVSIYTLTQISSPGSIYLHPHPDHLTCEYVLTPTTRPSHLWVATPSSRPSHLWVSTYSLTQTVSPVSIYLHPNPNHLTCEYLPPYTLTQTISPVSIYLHPHPDNHLWVSTYTLTQTVSPVSIYLHPHPDHLTCEYLHPHPDHLTCKYLPTLSPRPSHLWVATPSPGPSHLWVSIYTLTISPVSSYTLTQTISPVSIYLHPHPNHITCEYLPTPSPKPSYLWVPTSTLTKTITPVSIYLHPHPDHLTCEYLAITSPSPSLESVCILQGDWGCLYLGYISINTANPSQLPYFNVKWNDKVSPLINSTKLHNRSSNLSQPNIKCKSYWCPFHFSPNDQKFLKKIGCLTKEAQYPLIALVSSKTCWFCSLSDGQVGGAGFEGDVFRQDRRDVAPSVQRAHRHHSREHVGKESTRRHDHEDVSVRRGFRHQPRDR